MISFVIDASATLPWCFDDKATTYTEGLLDRCAAGKEVAVASIRPLEVTNVLVHAERRGRVTAERVEQFLEQLLRLRIHVEPCTTQRAGQEVRRLAQTYGLTAYDASYLAPAIQLNLPLATLDTDLQKAARAAGVPLIE